MVLLLAPELHTSSCTATSTTTATIESLSSLVVHNTQATPSTSTAVEPPVGAAIKRRGFFASTSATSNKRANKLSASDTHKQFGAMAEIKATQLKEQSTMLRVRDERDQLLHDLQLQKLQLEIEALKARERRQSELHQVDMDMKRAQLRLLKKQSDEEWAMFTVFAPGLCESVNDILLNLLSVAETGCMLRRYLDVSCRYASHYSILLNYISTAADTTSLCQFFAIFFLFYNLIT